MRKHYREIIYLIGDSEEKRRTMYNDQPGIARARGDEIADICRIDGRDYYILGSHPFGEFTVNQYVRYERSLLGAASPSPGEIRKTLARLGARVRLTKRVKRLGYLERRLVTLAGRITPDTRTLAVELDGVPYSRRLMRRLRRVTRRLSRWFEIRISVTDSRFAETGETLAELHPGSIIALGKYRLRSRPLSRRLLLARLRRCFVSEKRPLEKGKVTEIISCPTR